MTMRSFAILVFSGVIATTAALAASAPAAPAPPAPNATAPAAAPQNGPTDTETVGDWVVRCFAIKGPAPCDVLQVSVEIGRAHV